MPSDAPVNHWEDPPPMRRFSVLLCLSLFAALLAQAPAAAAKSCLGKKATITSNAKKIRGTKAPDVIVAGPGNNRILGEGGNDRICGGGGKDYIDGERGSDRASGDGGNDEVIGDRGKDTLFGGGGSDRVTGGRGSDDLDGGGGARDRVFGDEGNDRVSGGAGARDLVDEGLGDGPLVSGGGGGYDIVVGNSGVDRIIGGGGKHDIANYATSTVALNVDLGSGRMSGAERERLSGIEDVIGGSGNDSLQGNAASNRLDGGLGDDSLQAAGGGDAAFGGPGSDSCSGNFATENSCGKANESARIVGVELISSIDDTSSLVLGGTEMDDIINVVRIRGGYRVTSNGQSAVAPGDRSSTACNRTSGGGVECTGNVGRLVAAMGGGSDKLDASDLPRGTATTIDAGPGSDEIRGSNGPNTIYSGNDGSPDDLTGGSRSDILFGINTEHPKDDSGAAVMRGLGGNDLLVGGQPCDGDTYNGGAGANDSASFARVKNYGIFAVAEIGGKVTDPEVGSCNAGRILGNVEKIEGSKGPDRLTGDNSANQLLGRGGNDVMDGRGGFDRCNGGGGNDRARGCEKSY